MSTLYNLEPQPTAKVLLKTTSGDLLFELFAKQTPLTSRNFLQLCLDGYYDNTIFHRLVPNFVVQGGDPTGTGTGGLSSYDGEPFADEFHSRLKFNRRGLLGMANTGKKNDNGSQFFVTLGDTPELQGKNTMFGRIVGDTIYNLMRMGEAELAEEGGERPLYPTRVTGTEILVNPFEDVVKRVQLAQRTAAQKTDKKKIKRKAGKQLLSFGGDEGEVGDVAPVVKKAKFNPKLVSAGQEDPAILNNPPMPKAPENKAEKPTMKSRTTLSASPPLPSTNAKRTAAASLAGRPAASRSRSPPSSPEPPEVNKVSSLLERTNAQIAELKASMKRNTAATATTAPRKQSALEALIPATSTRGRKRRPGGTSSSATEERNALDAFNAFKSRLSRAPSEPQPAASPTRSPRPAATPANGARNAAAPAAGADGEAALCDLHFIADCQSCTSWDAHAAGGADARDEDDGGAAWMSHALSFAKDRLGKDLEWKRRNEEELVVIDPREKAREMQAEKRDRREKGRPGEGGRDRKK